MRTVAAFSEHPVAAVATGEILGRIGDAGAGRPDVAVVVLSGDHVQFHDEVVSATRRVFAGTTVVSATVPGVLDTERPGQRSAIGVIAWHDSGASVTSAQDPSDGHDRSALVFCTATPPAERWGRTRATAGVVVDGTVCVDGTPVPEGTAIVVPGAHVVTSTVALPIAAPLVVDHARAEYLLELDDTPAAWRVQALIDAAPPPMRARLARHGVLVATGGVITENAEGTVVLGDPAGELELFRVDGVDRRRGAVALDRALGAGAADPAGAVVLVAGRDRDVELQDVLQRAAACPTEAGAGAFVISDRSEPPSDADPTPIADTAPWAEVLGPARVLGVAGRPLARRGSHLCALRYSAVAFVTPG